MKTHINQQSPQRILGIFAHPDDEVFCAGGLLAQAAASGAETMLVSATRGEAGQIRDPRVATRQTLGKVRAQEFHRSGEQLGVRHTVCLDYGDGRLASLEPTILVEVLVHIIRRFRPDTVITFGPDGAYGHPDHTAIGAATTKAVALAGDARHFPEQLGADLSAHTPDRLYYSYFPRNQRLLSEQLVQWLVALRRRFQGPPDFAHALLLFSEEARMLGYIRDYVETSWFPSGFTIVEQDEPASKLYLILSGEAVVQRENSEGALETLACIGPGCFFGEEGLAYHQLRNAHVVADSDVTCLVFSPQAPTNFAGRGSGAQFAEGLTHRPDQAQSLPEAMVSLDVTTTVSQKVAALAAHRTQFPVEPDMLPRSIMVDLLGIEYFVQVYPTFEMKQDYFSITELLPAYRQDARREMATLS